MVHCTTHVKVCMILQQMTSDESGDIVFYLIVWSLSLICRCGWEGETAFDLPDHLQRQIMGL
jgi:hypothetical protein